MERWVERIPKEGGAAGGSKSKGKSKGNRPTSAKGGQIWGTSAELLRTFAKGGRMWTTGLSGTCARKVGKRTDAQKAAIGSRPEKRQGEMNESSDGAGVQAGSDQDWRA